MQAHYEIKHCPKCREPQPGNALFCNFCGHRFSQSFSRYKNRKSNNTRLAIAAVITLVVIAAIGEAFWSGFRPTNDSSSQAALVSKPAALNFASAAKSEYVEQESPNLVGKVVGIADGDTITVLDADKKQHKIRLAGIDAPEQGQDFSDKAKRMLSDLVYGKTVTVESDKIDKYGRMVGKVMVDGKDINLALVAAGLAWHYKKYEIEQSVSDRETYAAAESDARSRKLGLWSIAGAQAPWDFRAGVNNTDPSKSGKIIGNRNSLIYHWEGCPSYNKVAPHNQIVFDSPEAAEAAGYRAARNCTGPRPSSGTGTMQNSARATAPASVPLYSAPAPTPRSQRSNGYIRGPRGGCYYINGSGRKTYVDRSLCN